MTAPDTAPVAVKDKLLLTPAEAAALCSLGRDRALALVHLGEQRGGWRAIRVGGRYYVPRRWLEESWIANLRDGQEVAV